MQKLGMKPVPGISRVTIKKSKNVGGLWSRLIACYWVVPSVALRLHSYVTGAVPVSCGAWTL